MRLLKLLLLAASLSFIAASASSQTLKPGVNYLVLASPGATDAGNKVEVMEFFAYFCPHCYRLDPLLEAWVKKQGDKIVFKRVHSPYYGKVLPQQRMYFALEAMGLTEQFHKKIFDAIHLSRKSLNEEADILAFVVSQGVDRQKFVEAYDSFSVQTKVRRIAQLEVNYKLEGVPNIVIDGRFVAGPSVTANDMPSNTPEPALQAATLDVMSALVDKILAERAAKK